MKNSVLEIDPKRYGRLLARKLPAVIRTEEENERLIGELEQMDQRHDELTPEEREYSELLTVLIEAFEDANYALEGSTPDSRLRICQEGAWPVWPVPIGRGDGGRIEHEDTLWPECCKSRPLPTRQVRSREV